MNLSNPTASSNDDLLGQTPGRATEDDAAGVPAALQLVWLALFVFVVVYAVHAAAPVVGG